MKRDNYTERTGEPEMPEKQELSRKYEISAGEAALCLLFRRLLGRTKAMYFMFNLSKKRYGKCSKLGRYCCESFWGCSVGKWTYGFKNVKSLSRVASIGKFCSIADNILIVPNDHETEWITTHPAANQKYFGFVETDLGHAAETKRKVVIGNDVWIGTNSMIFEGVKIGDGAVIAAGSIIRKDVPPYAVVGGVDRIIKYRFSQEIIEKLLKIQWWDWTDEKIKENILLMQKPEEFAAKFS